MLNLNAGLYNDHNDLQINDIKELFPLWKEKLHWEDHSGETIMDIGCGTGNSSTEFIHSQFPNVKRIIATDATEDMIQLAKSKNSHTKVEYFVADIQDESSLREWFGTVSKVISIHCFHWVKEQTQAFRNVFNLLKPGGEAALLFALSAPIFKTFRKMKENPKWKEITEGISCCTPESELKNFDPAHYKKVFSDIGFVVILCEKVERKFTFPNDEKFKGALTSLCPFMKRVPDPLKKEFEQDLLQASWELSSRCPDGQTVFKFMALNVLLQRPFGKEA